MTDKGRVVHADVGAIARGIMIGARGEQAVVAGGVKQRRSINHAERRNARDDAVTRIWPEHVADVARRVPV